MPPRSALARLQQITTLFLVALAGAWFAWQYPDSPIVAAAGAFLIAFSYALVLAAQFVLLITAGRSADVPRPTMIELLKAWLAEVVEALRVFAWRQPFRWRQFEDHLGADVRGKRGVVFIHGFICNRGLWSPWLSALRARGHGFAAINLEPVFGPIDLYVPTVADAVQRVRDATGMAPVLVCHSMGGLAARAWLRMQEASAQVHRVVTIGSPHQGTWLARFSTAQNARQIRPDSEWLVQLRRDEAQRPPVAFTCWYSNCDNIVFPVATATLPGADNRLVRGAAHVDLAFRADVMETTLREITAH